MIPISSWAIAAREELLSNPPVAEKTLQKYQLTVRSTYDGLWSVVRWPKGKLVAFRMAFSPGNRLNITNIEESDDWLQFTLEAHNAFYQVVITLPADASILHYKTTLTPKEPLMIPYWPKDILPMTSRGQLQKQGEIHVSQVGIRSGLMYFSMAGPDAGSVMYFQNLTSLGPYCEATKTSSANLVGSKWPEIGFALPVTKEDPLPAGEVFSISDAYVLLSEQVPKSKEAVAKQFLNHLADLYLKIPRPDTSYHHWPDTAERGLDDLGYHKGCWTFAGGHPYLNAYVSDYKTPAEIMVQLAVLLPLREYMDWKGEQQKIVGELTDGLPAFYHEKMKTIVRWLPKMEDNLDKSEEQKRERIMDSWYLHHPLMNLARLAKKGEEIAKKLLLDSIGYVINVAHHFKYNWPVFYRMDTLEVIKEETQPGEGGEKDVPGCYAHLMLEVWDLTGDERYLKEAKKAAKSLSGLGPDIFYQANNTAFAAQAMLRLFKITGDQQYLDLSYGCLAGLFRNVQLWDCEYGYGKHFPTFFAIFPLNDAPYTAAYEELEVYAGLSAYLKEAEGVDILPSARLLIAEFLRYAVTRIPYYYPPMLPKEMLSKEVKTGEIDPSLWIPLEDIHDGWEASGEVGQEVYGAGIAFGIVPRQYIKVPGEDFLVYVDYPVSDIKIAKDKRLSFKTGGDGLLGCLVIIISMQSAKEKPYKLFAAPAGDKTKAELKPKNDQADMLEFHVSGNQSLELKW
jgi:hypothetical protein